MKIIDSIKEEHTNRTQWLDEHLTMRERARVEREVAIKIVIALIVYIGVMCLIEFCLT